MPYHFRGNEIQIPRGAEISGAFEPGPDSAFGPLVQDVLDRMEPWGDRVSPIQEFDLPRFVGARVAQLAQIEHPRWGVNPYHTAKIKHPSPYIDLEPESVRQRTKIATLELVGTVEKPILTRIYPGEYMPPLPWMRSNKQAPGGRQECIDFWSSHAYILRRGGAVVELSDVVPPWYKKG